MSGAKERLIGNKRKTHFLFKNSFENKKNMLFLVHSLYQEDFAQECNRVIAFSDARAPSGVLTPLDAIKHCKVYNVNAPFYSLKNQLLFQKNVLEKPCRMQETHIRFNSCVSLYKKLGYRHQIS